MWLYTAIRFVPRTARQRWWKGTFVLSCDHCQACFERKWGKSMAAKSHHYCSHTCATAAAPRDVWTSERRAQRAKETAVRNKARWADPEARKQQATATARTHLDPDLKARRSATMRQTMSTPAFKKKRALLSRLMSYRAQETNRKNGNVRESAPERAFVAWLRAELGAEDIVHHPARVNGADIDVYIRSIDTYVQFDGIYYHGLDRPYEQLSPVIRRKFDRDRLVDTLFKNIGLKLRRITDKEWRELETPEAKRAWLVGS